ncbi:uncharacterized protein A1O5_13350 [Cladophialophora psammophila CBS 110553]|uniref:Uncharacterized protein n=1 Tax=Cladophialophora psammophila CBS 110553 TaxID=1182543 RepID=W9VMS4_9EURO|nr:uncharacterized protein A1O5_13350 [Cladophialophora psammophila CBS 110553]EXJ53416.1 hypothetical protein A1O5_13350 [Cladophialophora psammophila CBS 110553]
MFETVLIVAIAARSVDFVEALLDAQVVAQFSSAKWSMVALTSAAEWSQLDVFKKILKISAPLSLDDAHTVLGLTIQYKGHSQLAIALAFIEYLDEHGTIKEVVNYREPSACAPFCDKKHDHFFYPTQFWNAVDERAYDIANILASYEDTEADGLPTTLFHVIKTLKANMLSQLHFLFNLGPQHSKYVCDPVRGVNALHVVVESSGSSVLKTVLEWFAEMGEDINAPDKNGATALHFGAFCPSLDAVELLIRYGADPGVIDSRGLTAYDMALGLARYAATQMSEFTGQGVTSVVTMRERRPRETDERRATVEFTRQMCGIFVQLSKPGSQWRPEDAVGLVEDPPPPDGVVKGLVPISASILFSECKEYEAENVPLQAWARLEEGKVGFCVNIRLLDEFTRDQLMFVAMETLHGRDGSICQEFTMSPYLYRNEIYPVRH